MRDINARVADYRPQVEDVARRLAGSRAARDVGAEYDDLVQEGLISVWQALQRGVTPSMEVVLDRMKSWMRLLARQTGRDIPQPLRPQHIPYEQLLPLDDLRAAGED